MNNANPIQAEVVDTLSFASTLPDLPYHYTPRDDQVTLIENHLKGDPQILFIHADEGLGKTSVLVEFAKAHRPNTLALFFRGVAGHTFSPSFIKYELAAQLTWLIRKEAISPDADPSDADVESLFARAQRHLRRQQSTAYIIIDGVYEGEARTQQALDVLRALVPFGLPEFRIILSAQNEDQVALLLQRQSYQRMQLPPLQKRAADDLLADLVADGDLRAELLKTCRYEPGRIATLRRILESGEDPEEIASNLSVSAPDLFRIEWSRKTPSREDFKLAIAFLAFQPNNTDIVTLAERSRMPVDDLSSCVESVPYLQFEDDRRRVSFISDAYRLYAKRELEHLEKTVRDRILEHLRNNPESEEALTDTPHHLAEAGRDEELFDWITTDTLLRIAGSTSSLKPATNHLDLGLAAASRSSKLQRVIDFSVKRSLLSEVPTSGALKAELRAALSLDRRELALSLVRSARLKEDRLELLGIAANHFIKMKEDEATIESLKEEISVISNDCQPDEIGINRATEIAQSIYPVDPETAIEFVQRAASASGGDADQWAMLRFSLTAVSPSNGEVDRRNALRLLREKLPEVAHDDVEAAVSIMAAEESTVEFANELRNLNDPVDALLVAEYWCENNQDNIDAYPVIEFAVETALRTTEFNPTCVFYADVLKPLPKCDGGGDVHKIIKIIDGQKDALLKFGPTHEFVEVQISLAETIANLSKDDAKNRLVDVYIDVIATLDDPSVKAGCLAQLATALQKIDRDGYIEEQEGLVSLVWQELQKAVSITLHETASQEEALKRMFTELAAFFPEYAVETAQSLNIMERRGLATESVLRVYTQDKNDPNFSWLKKTLDKIGHAPLRDRVILEGSRRIQRVAKEGAMHKDIVHEWAELAGTMQHMESKCEVCSRLIVAGQSAVGQGAEIPPALLDELRGAWHAVDAHWLKIKTAFSLVARLSSVDESLAEEFLQGAARLRSDSRVESFDVAQTVILAMTLAIRGLRAIKGDPDAVDRLTQQLRQEILALPSVSYRLILLSELSLTLSFDDHTRGAKQVATDDIPELIMDLEKRNKHTFGEIAVKVSPSLWFAHRTTLYEILAKLTTERRDRACREIAKAVIRKVPPGHPFSPDGTRKIALDYGDLKELLEIIGSMRSDSMIYGMIHEVSQITENARKKHFINRNQIAEIVRGLNELVASKLPAPFHIQHKGYAVASTARIGMIDRGKNVDWQGLEKSAREIDNVADKAYVLMILAESLPTKKRTKAEELLRDAEAMIEDMACVFDKITRYQALAESAWSIDLYYVSHRALKRAVALCYGADDPEMEDQSRKLIDLAHRISPDLPNQLIEALDDDPARRRSKESLKEHARFLNYSSNVWKKDQETEKEDGAIRWLAQACWRQLGAMQAGRAEPLDRAKMNWMLSEIGGRPFVSVYPVFALTVASLQARSSSSGANNQFAIELVENVVSGVRLLLRICDISSGDSRWQDAMLGLQAPEESQEFGDGIVIHPGERERALRVIADWLEAAKPDFIRIIDPYFCLEDLEAVRIVSDASPGSGIEIITSEEVHHSQKVTEPWLLAYQNFWRRNISDELPPDCTIRVMGMGESGRAPFHDRWWLCGDKGLRMGTSFNGFGGSKVSEISFMDEHESSQCEAEIDRYVANRVRFVQGEKIRQTMFHLDESAKTH